MAYSTVQDLAWDSEFFGLSIGEMIVESTPATFSHESDRFDLLYVKGNTDFTVTGQKESFSETKVVFGKKLHSKPVQKSESVYLDRDVSYDIEKIYDLAFESGKHSRFKLDTNFGEEKFKSLYKIWVDNSINRKFADAVLFYVDANDILGFVTYKIHSDFATIGLIAVSANAQGKGIGGQLLNETERLLVGSGITELRIPTQLANKGACSFYEKHGYKIIETAYIKHYWKSK